MAVTSVPIIIFGIVAFQLSSTRTEHDFIVYKHRIIQQISKNIDEYIRSLQRQSLVVYTNPEDVLRVLMTPKDRIDNGYLQAYNRLDIFFKSMLQSNEKMYSMYLVSLNGEIVYYIDRDHSFLNFNTVENEAWFAETIAKRGTSLLQGPHQNHFLGTGADKWRTIISVSRTILNINANDNQPVGVLVLDQDVRKFNDILANMETEEEELIAVVGRSGELIYSNTPLAASYDMHKLTAAGSDGGRWIDTFNGQQMLLTQFTSSDTGWKVVSLVPLAVIDSKSAYLKNLLVTLLLVMIALTLLISILFTKIVSNPLKKLAFSFGKFQRGDFTTALQVRGEDEFAQIAKTFNKMVVNLRELIEQKYEMTILFQQAELKALQNQINPHFLYNTLASIKAVIHKKDTDSASLMIGLLSDMFRYNLRDHRHLVKFSDELTYTRRYLDIQHFRFGDKYEVEYDLDENIFSCGILRLTLQPIIENSLIHGLEPLKDKGRLTIGAKMLNDRLLVYISDNGVGIAKDRLQEIHRLLEATPDIQPGEVLSKVGLTNVHARIKQYFGAPYGLGIFSTPGVGTTVKIMMPIHQPDWSEAT